MGGIPEFHIGFVVCLGHLGFSEADIDSVGVSVHGDGLLGRLLGRLWVGGTIIHEDCRTWIWQLGNLWRSCKNPQLPRNSSYFDHMLC